MNGATLAILAGGKSSRMNYNNKAFLAYKNVSFIERIIEAGNAFNEIIIIANDPTLYAHLGKRVIGDVYKQCGPLSGIHAALVAAETEHVVCVACDMPFLKEELLASLAAYQGTKKAVIPEYEGRLQPLCAMYRKELAEVFATYLKEGQFKLQQILQEIDIEKMERIEQRAFQKEDFLNVNTPQEYKELEE